MARYHVFDGSTAPQGEPRDTDPLHEQLQEHLQNCAECMTALETTPPRAFGHKGRYCAKYYEIVALWSQGEFTRDEDRKLSS